MSTWNNEKVRTGAREQQRVKSVYKIMKIVKAELIVLFILMAVFGIQMIGKNINRNNLNNRLNAVTNPLTITDEDRQVGEKIKVSAIQVSERTTGIGEFDNDNTPGNDKDQYNNIVRSSDKVTWTVVATMSRKDNSEAEINGGVLRVEAELPDLKFEGTPAVYKWDLSGMTWAKNAEVLENGRKFVGNFQLPIYENGIDGAQQEFLLAMDVLLGAPNGMEIKPKITVSLEGNEENDKESITFDKEDETKLDSKVIVSAKPAIDILISKTSLNTNGYYDLESGIKIEEGEEEGGEEGEEGEGEGEEGETENPNIKYGNMQGYGIGLRIYQENTNKGLKGIEIPSGDITFDLTLSQSIADESLNTQYPLDPIFWDYNENMTTKTGKNGRTMLNANHPSLPYNSGASSKSCNNGGTWTIVQDSQQKNVYHVTISGYKFNSAFSFPSETSGGTSTSSKYFSTGYFEALLQIPEEVENLENIIMKAEISNINYKSITNQEGQDELLTNNKSEIGVNLYPPEGSSASIGGFEKRLWFIGGSKSGWASGDASAIRGKNLSIKAYLTTGCKIGGAEILFKFDDKAIEPRLSNNAEYIVDGKHTMKFNVLYAGKLDKSGWTSESEMNNTTMDQLIYFDTIEEINEAGYVCVGAMLESTSGYISKAKGNSHMSPYLPIRVKEDAEIGKVYQALMDLRFYDMNNIPDRTIHSHLIPTNPDDYPPRVWGQGYYPYKKTVYNDEGKKIGGHTCSKKGLNGYNVGDSLLVIGAEQNITIDREKEKYSLNQNENIAPFTITPTITGNQKIEGINLKITAVLPVGLTYIPGTSSYEEPEIITNSNGTTTLVWYKNNRTVNVEVGQIKFDTLIDEDTPNNKQYTISTTITEVPRVVNGNNVYVIRNNRPGLRTASTTIQVENLGGYSTYKETETAIVEKDGTIKFKVVGSNRKETALDTFQMLDIMPYNGDERGTAYNGTYTVESINVKVLNSNKEEVTDHNIKLYVSENENIRTQDAKTIDFSMFEEVESGNINRTITGLALKGTLPAYRKVEVEITLKPEGNKPNDKYINSATMQTNPNVSIISTKSVKAEVIKRYLDGKVWLDNNRNGIIDEEENFIKDVKVTLLNSDETPAKNIEGNTIEHTYTNKEGYYKFEDMLKGTYKVKIEYEDKYVLTEKEVGLNEEINSKFNDTDDETDEITRLNIANNPLTVQEHINAGLTLRGGNLIVHHYIIKPDGTKTTTRVLLPTGEEAPDETKEGNVGDNYETAKVEPIEYYEYVEDTGNTTGTYTAASETTPIEVIYYYRLKKYPYTVRYYDKEKLEEIKTEKTVEDKYYGDEILVTSEKIDIEKYEYDSSDVGKTNKEDKEKLTIGTNVEENVINLYYIKKKGTVITKYIDINTGKEIADQETTTDRIDEKYTTIKKEIAGYTFVESTDNTEGVYTIESVETPIEVIYFYKKNTKVTVNHIDKDTGELLDTLTEGGLVGDEYESTSKNFEGYILVEVPEEERVILTEEEIILNYYYSKVPEVIIDKESGGVIEKHIAEDTGKLLYNELHTGNIGDKYDIGSRSFEGYHLVKEKLPSNSKGEMRKELQEVIYYYIPKTFNLKVEKWVETASINGTSFRMQQYNSRDKISKLEIKESKIEDVEVILTYKIRITNTSEVEGYVEALSELIPEGYEFRQEDNKANWRKEGDVIVTNDLKETKIEPGKHKEIEIVLRWKNGETNFGEKTNIVTLAKVRNPYNYKEQTNEDNQYTSKMVISLTTGLDRSDKIQITKISIYAVSGLIVLAFITNRARKRK